MARVECNMVANRGGGGYSILGTNLITVSN
jgi:hypothetical protein